MVAIWRSARFTLVEPRPTVTPALEIQDLRIGYRDGGRCRIVADGLQASLMAGRMAALVGRNGCGKSTLLRTLAGLQPALGGTVRIDGDPISKLSADTLARRVGIVLTTRPDLGHTTVRELVRYGRIPYARIFGGTTEADDRAVEEAISQTHAADLADRYLHTLSDGERTRAFIAKAIAQGTRTLLLDEPTAFLDYPAKIEILNLLRDLAHSHGKAILISSHDIDLAARDADTFWHLRAAALSEIPPHPMRAEEI